MSIALVPVKHLDASKSRLLPELDGRQRRALSLAMLEDVVAALRGVPSLDRVAVVTPDTAVAEAARAAGAEALERRDPGLNAAIEGGARELAPGRREPLLVVLGDVAGARSEELEMLCRVVVELGEPAAVLAPSRDGGTSALLRVPHDCFPPHFGRESAKAHREAAARAGVTLRELALPSLAIDLDRPEDVEAFLASRGGGARTRALLKQLGWGRRA